MSAYRNIVDRLTALGGAFGTLSAKDGSFTGSRAFLARVRAVHELSDFLVREGAAPSPNPAVELGQLNDLAWRPGAPMPNEQAWRMVETLYCDLHAAMTIDLRKKYLLRQFPLSIIWLSITALVISLLALTGAVYPAALGRIWTAVVRYITADVQFSAALSSITLWDFIVWNISLGILGSVAFIAVNALSIQSDASFDISNRAFVYLRIILGALFGVMVAIPLAYPNFAAFCDSMGGVVGVVTPNGNGGKAVGELDSRQVVFLLLPFLVGFSTTLFLSLITRLLNAVQTLFGIGGEKTTTTAAADGSRTVQTVRPPSGPSSIM